MSTPSDPGSGQPDPWAVPPSDAPGQSTSPPSPPQPPPPMPPPPAYGQQPPAYGAPQPAYGQPPYGGAQPGYGQPAPGYGYPPALTYSYASWGNRVLSAIVDGVIIAIPAVVLALIFVAIHATIGAVLVYIVAIGASFYNLYLGGSTGQTWGKKIIGTKLLKEQTGQPIGGGMGILRAFVHVVDSLPCYLGYLWPLWDAKKQTFADKIMGSVVIKF